LVASTVQKPAALAAAAANADREKTRRQRQREVEEQRAYFRFNLPAPETPDSSPRESPTHAGAASPHMWEREHSPGPANATAAAPVPAAAAAAVAPSRSASPGPAASAAAAAAVAAAATVVPVVLSEDDAAALILHGDAKRAWADIEGGAVVVPRDVATAVLLRYSRHVDGVTEPLERLMLLVDKLKADVNAQDAADRATPLHSLFMHPMQVRPRPPYPPYLDLIQASI